MPTLTSIQVIAYEKYQLEFMKENEFYLSDAIISTGLALSKLSIPPESPQIILEQAMGFINNEVFEGTGFEDLNEFLEGLYLDKKFIKELLTKKEYKKYKKDVKRMKGRKNKAPIIQLIQLGNIGGYEDED